MSGDNFLQARLPVNDTEAVRKQIECPAARRLIWLRWLHREYHREQHESACLGRVREARLHGDITAQRGCLRATLPHNASRSASPDITNCGLINRSGWPDVLRRDVADSSRATLTPELPRRVASVKAVPPGMAFPPCPLRRCSSGCRRLFERE